MFYYEEFGEGKPILIIHGLACSMGLMKGCIEPIFKEVNGYKRIYIDLLGMGKSNKCSLEYASSDKILEMLLSFIKEKIDKEFLLIGESYGGYLSRGILSKCYKNIEGLMLLCPMIIPDDTKRTLPEGNLKFHDKEFLEKMNKNRRELFLEYMIIANEKMYKRFEKEVISGIEQANNDFIKKLRENYSFSFNVDEEIKMINFSKPSLFITGRQDNTVGYYDLYNLLEDYPRATFAILDTAGHNLQIEQEEVFNSLSSFVCFSGDFLGSSVFVSTFMLLISKFLIGSIFKKLFDEVSSLFLAVFSSSILVSSKSLKSSFI